MKLPSVSHFRLSKFQFVIPSCAIALKLSEICKFHPHAADAIILLSDRAAAAGLTFRECGMDGDVTAIGFVQACGHPDCKPSRDTNHACLNAGNTVRENKAVAKALGRGGAKAVQDTARLHIKKADGDPEKVGGGWGRV